MSKYINGGKELFLIVKCQLMDGKGMMELEYHQRNWGVKIMGKNVMREDISVVLMHHSTNYLCMRKKNTVILHWWIMAGKHFSQVQKTCICTDR